MSVNKTKRSFLVMRCMLCVFNPVVSDLRLNIETSYTLIIVPEWGQVKTQKCLEPFFPAKKNNLSNDQSNKDGNKDPKRTVVI